MEAYIPVVDPFGTAKSNSFMAFTGNKVALDGNWKLQMDDVCQGIFGM